MARIIGITGPSGSGKSLLCKYISELGIPCIDADAVYHDMLVPPSRCLDEIVKVFGEELLTEDGALDRRVLSERVLSDPEQLELLNRTVLPIVIDKINSNISTLTANGAKTVVLDAPTLIESGFHTSCDMIVVVIAPIESRIARIKRRDKISEEHARQRVLSQKSDDFYSEFADITLFNDKSEAEFSETVKNVASAILEL